MKAAETRAEIYLMIYLMALQSLSKTERETVIARLSEDPKLREEILDLITIHQRQGEPSRHFREYLTETGKGSKDEKRVHASVHFSVVNNKSIRGIDD